MTTSIENLNRDQKDTVCEACTLEPCIQIMRITTVYKEKILHIL